MGGGRPRLRYPSGMFWLLACTAPSIDVPVTAGTVLLRADINADYACDTTVWADVTGW